MVLQGLPYRSPDGRRWLRRTGPLWAPWAEAQFDSRLEGQLMLLIARAQRKTLRHPAHYDRAIPQAIFLYF